MVFHVPDSFLGRGTQHCSSEEGGQGRAGAEVVRPPACHGAQTSQP